MGLMIPDWPGLPPNIGVISTTRQGGISQPPYDDGYGGGGLNLGAHVGDFLQDVQQNRLLLQASLPDQPKWLSQVHGCVVVDAMGVVGAPEADASFSTQVGVVCAVQTADCLPVLFCDERGRVVAAAHAGWRGLVGGVLENVVASMRQTGAGNILAWLGPAIGPAHFQVGEDVLDAFIARDASTHIAFLPIVGKPEKYLVDIYLLSRILLLKVDVNQVSGGGVCTVADAKHFYSYRRDKVTGRMASLIWIR